MSHFLKTVKTLLQSRYKPIIKNWWRLALLEVSKRTTKFFTEKIYILVNVYLFAYVVNVYFMFFVESPTYSELDIITTFNNKFTSQITIP